METAEKKKEKKQMPERQKEFKISDNTTTLSYKVDFPNTGQLLEIEVSKAQLSRSMYAGIIESGTFSSRYARQLIDMIAVFNVLFPKLREDLSVQTISELAAVDSKRLLKVYINQVLPWLNSWFEFLNDDDEDENVE